MPLSTNMEGGSTMIPWYDIVEITLLLIILIKLLEMS